MTTQTLPAWDCHTHVFDDPSRRALEAGAHYSPPHRTWTNLSDTGAPQGITRFVLVQPSVYGSDNSLLFDAMRQSAGRARGVLVLDDHVSDTELQTWFGLGARGVRFNAVSGAGNGIANYARLAPRLRQAGWHAQFFISPETLGPLHELASQASPSIVVDHLGGAADGPEYATIRTALFRLLDLGHVWVKASGFYRYGYPLQEWRDRFGELLRTLAERYPERVVWASDWPHTWFFDPAKGPPVAYADLLGLLRQSVSSAHFEQILRVNPATLYGDAGKSATAG